MRFGQGADINRETRINADMLHVLTQDEELDSDDEAGMVALSTKPATSLPMGIYRREHKEAEIIVATTAELEAAENATGEEESLWVDGGSGDQTPEVPIPDQPPEEGVWDTGSKKPVKVKTEPGEEGDEASMMDIDPKMPDSPEEKKKKPVEIKVKKALPQDPEDGRIEADYNLLASELGTVTITDEKGETRTEGPLDKDGRLYLFQFPPLLPPLKASAASRKGKVKSEAQDFSMEDVPSANGGEVDLTTEKDGEEGLDADDPENEKGFMSSLMSQGGMIGQLKVRKSGKVEFDWGGRTLEMSSATSMNFLSTAVMLEENDEKPHPEVIGGSSVGMGKIMGRFILAPSWGEEEDWVVTEEDLRIPEPEAVDA
jgi:DNA-directed RNA polymerase III subunit RPC4